MVPNPPNDGRIGKEIDWSLVIPSITRPTWEPPALEVLDFFETIFEFSGFNINSDKMKTAWPDPEVRTRLVDLMCECHSLRTYHAWVVATQGTAKEVGDGQKKEFYEGLAAAVMVDWVDVYKETIPLVNANFPGTPISELQSEREDDEGGGDDDYKYDSSSTTSYVTAKDDISAHSLEDIRGLIDLDPSSSRPGVDLPKVPAVSCSRLILQKRPRLSDSSAKEAGSAPSADNVHESSQSEAAVAYLSSSALS